MSINDRLAAQVVRMLDKHGFDATLQQRVDESEDELEAGNSTWNDLDTVKAVWDNPRNQFKGLNDEAPASVSTRRMTIAYRDDLKATESAVSLRVLVNGVANNIQAIGEIGEKVGLRLMLDAGTEPV